MRKPCGPKYVLFLCGLLLLAPARCFAAADEDAPKTERDALPFGSLALPGLSLASNDTADPPRPHSSKEEAGHVGAGLRLSTLGAGAEAAVSLTNRLNIRGGFNIFEYGRGFNHDGVAYKGQLNLRSGEAHLDWYPLGCAFHVSPGHGQRTRRQYLHSRRRNLHERPRQSHRRDRQAGLQESRTDSDGRIW